ncbi:MAG: cobalt-precorrin 5A hydrolase [Prevotella sp.]|nr:cobalt-precorrin 5A hydrolase [Prevotella sp.]
MKIAIISVSEKGRVLTKKIKDFFEENHIVKRYCFYKYSDEFSESFSDIYTLIKKIFYENDALIFVCSCGIAVRSIASLIKSKISDPAVIAVDDCGKFAVPILSGHIGGANRIAEIIAKNIGAAAVITTATDADGKFSPDLFAAANNLLISDFNTAKKIAAVVLSNEKIGIKSDFPYENLPFEICENNNCGAGICISENISEKPFDLTLNLIPKNVVLGIGCKKNTACDVIEKQVKKAFLNAKISIERICAAATIEIKAEEKGLIEFCENIGISLQMFTAVELMNVNGKFESSEFVMSKTGADNVCERSAVLCSGGNIVIPKFSENGVTVAAAEIPIKLDFKRKIF